MTQKAAKTKRISLILSILLASGFLVIIAAQYLMIKAPIDNNRLPSPWYLLNFAGVVLIIIGFFLHTRARLKTGLVERSRFNPVYWVGLSVFLIALTVFSLLYFLKKDYQNYDFVTICWFLAGAIYIFAFNLSIPRANQIKQWMKLHRNELLLVLALVIFAAILRLIKLGALPRVIDGDEGLLGLFAQGSDTGVYTNPFALWENFGGIYLQLINTAIKIFGPEPFALRILPAISGILAIPALYLFARQVAGRRIAVISAFLLAISHAHIHFSRIGSVGYIHGTWLVPLELYLLLAGLEKRKMWMAAAGGVILAIHFSIYLTAQVILGMLFVFTLILIIFYRKWLKNTWRQMAAFWGGFALMVMPEFSYIVQNPHAFFDRLNANGTFQSGWLELTMSQTGRGAFSILAERVAHAFFSLIYYPAKDFYGSNFSILSNITTILFLVGLILAIAGTKKRGFLLLNGYFWAPTIAIGIFSIPPSADSYRILMVLPAALLLAAIGFDRILELIGITITNQKTSYVFVTSCLLVCLAVINIWAYFGDFVGQCRYSGDLASRFASYLGSYTKTLNYGTPIYLLSNDVYRSGTHASTEFLSGGRKIENVEEPLSLWEPKTGDVLIASPDRIGELQNWMLSHPGGKRDFLFDCKNLILLGYTVH